MSTTPQTGALVPPERPRWEVADILRAHQQAYLEHFPITPVQRKALAALVACRTAALGGHVEWCAHCDYQRIAYNSCRNRHCPKCQALAQWQWLEQRRAAMLPVSHFHVVFTLPEGLRALVRQNQRTLYGLLFSAATETLQAFGDDPKYLGAQLGITAVLHTWTRTLAYHPHLHCIVTAGGLSWDQERWVPSAQRGRYLFPVKALGKLFRGKFLAQLRTLYQAGALYLGGGAAAWQAPAAFEVLLRALYGQAWVVYAKRPLGGAEQVYAYLGRYTHRVGLSNSRLREVTATQVRFRTKGGQECTLAPLEFLRRFLLHVLPVGFVKIRHYGLLAGRNVKSKLARARSLLQAAVQPAAVVARAPDAVASAAPPLAGASAPMPPSAPPQPAWLPQAGADRDLARCPRCGHNTLHRLPLSFALRPAAMSGWFLTPGAAGTWQGELLL